MRKLLLLAAMFAIAAFGSPLAQSQTTGTNLVIQARWNTGSVVKGAVTLGQVNATGPDTVLVTKSLSRGGASFQTSLAAASVYDVTLTDSAGTQLVKFPFTTALIDPANLEQASITLVFNSTNNNLQSASVNVVLNF
jgi:hypothetical protein